MAVHDAAAGLIQQAILKQRPQVVAFDGPQEGVIVTATLTEATVTLTDWTTGYTLPAPAPLPYGLTAAPAKGTRCLVVFVGPGPGNPWIVALTSVPRPQ